MNSLPRKERYRALGSKVTEAGNDGEEQRPSVETIINSLCDCFVERIKQKNLTKQLKYAIKERVKSQG